MFIKNLKTGLVQECRNKDVLRVCKKSPMEYKVADTAEELEAETMKEELGVKKTQEVKNFTKMKVDELKALAEEIGIEAAESLTKDELVAVLKEAMAK